MVGPAEHARLVEGAIEDQLAPSVETVEQAGLARRPVEGIVRLHVHPRHPPALRSQGVAGAAMGLLLHQQLLVGLLPRLGETTGGVCMVGWPPVRPFSADAVMA